MSSQSQVVHVTPGTITARNQCSSCLKTYTTKFNLDRHIKQEQCKGIKVAKEKNLSDEVHDLKTQMEKQGREFAQLKKLIIRQNKPQLPASNTNNLNVMCLGSKDNLLDILVAKQGILEALTMVKDSAMNRLAGACTILERTYCAEGVRPAIMHPGKSKSTYVYYDENNKRVVEKNSSTMAKKLADIVQRTYLKGMSCLKKDILGADKTDGAQHYQAQMAKLRQVDLIRFELDPYDIQIWLQAVHELRDENYQKKMLKQLKIPFEDDWNENHHYDDC